MCSQQYVSVHFSDKPKTTNSLSTVNIINIFADITLSPEEFEILPWNVSCIMISVTNDNHQSTPLIRRFEVQVQMQTSTSGRINFTTVLEVIEDGND